MTIAVFLSWERFVSDRSFPFPPLLLLLLSGQ
jgi:hypothetical protein